MEQRITRAKARIAAADVSVRDARAPTSAPSACAAVAAMIYLVFNEGYSATRRRGAARAPRCATRRSGSPACCCACFPTSRRSWGCSRCCCLQHARAPARLDADGAIVLLEDQDRGALGSPGDRRRRRRCSTRRCATAGPAPTRCRRRSRPCTSRGHRRRDTDWAADRLALRDAGDASQPSPVVTLNRAVAVAKVRGPAAALALIEPLAPQLSGYFYFFGVRGALLMQLGRTTRRASPSTARSRSPTPPPRRRTSACTSIVWRAAPDYIGSVAGAYASRRISSGTSARE